MSNFSKVQPSIPMLTILISIFILLKVHWIIRNEWISAESFSKIVVRKICFEYILGRFINMIVGVFIVNKYHSTIDKEEQQTQKVIMA